MAQEHNPVDRQTKARMVQSSLAVSGLTNHNLPAPLTPLAGRQVELQRIAQRLGDTGCRLVTLTGPGGVGKTRLALEAAWLVLRDPALRTRFTDGCCLVELAEVRTAEQLAGALAAALPLDFDPARELVGQLIAALRTSRRLLVLDNLEHLTAELGLIIRLLEGAPELAILATSQERLNLAGEWLVEVNGLAVPMAATDAGAAGYPAIEFFVQSAQAQGTTIVLANDLPAVVAICQQLQGLPLGILLAANATRSYNCGQIAEALRTSIDFVTVKLRNLPPRHRSLRAVFSYTWGLLTPIEQQLLQQLAVFVGTFAESAAMDVAGATPPLLATLADKSLVQRQRLSPQNPELRYQLHPTIRQFANEEAAAFPALGQLVRNRHCTFYCRALNEQNQRLRAAPTADALRQLRADWENMVAAWRWAAATVNLSELEGSTPSLVALYLLHGPLLELRTLLQETLRQVRPRAEEQGSEGQRAAQRVCAQLHARSAQVENERGDYQAASEAAQAAIELAQTARDAEGEAQGALEWGRACFFQGRYEEAHKHLGVAMATALSARSQPLLAAIHAVLGANWLYRGDYQIGRDHCEVALKLYEELGDQTNVVKLRYNMALVLFYSGEFIQARAVFADCLAYYQALDERRSAGLLLNNLGAVALQLGDYTQARHYFEEALALKRASGDRPYESLILANLGLLESYRADFQRATAACREALQISQELGERSLIAYAQTCFGQALTGLGWFAEAADLFLAALNLRQELGQKDQALEPLAGLASVYLALEQPTQALAYVEQIMPRLNQVTAAGIVEPFRIYLTCYRVLTSNHDLRAMGVLTAAHEALQGRAKRIPSETMRHIFLEQIAVHREILVAFAQAPSERRSESSQEWRTRIAEHTDLAHDLETLIRTPDNPPADG
jgi:predicted ATPase